MVWSASWKLADDAHISFGWREVHLFEKMANLSEGKDLGRVGLMTTKAKPRHFLTTRWTLLNKCSKNEEVEALDQLCSQYWGPVRGFLRRIGLSSEDADDMTQDFFQEFMRRDGFARARKEKGRFRSFLLAAVRNHFANAQKAAKRIKRGGRNSFVEVSDELDSDPNLTPGEAFDKRWAEDVVDRALKRLRDEWVAAERPFEILAPYLSGERGAVPLEETARILGVSLAAAKSSVHRLRRQFGDLVKDEVRRTVGRDDDAVEELDYLMQMLSRT